MDRLTIQDPVLLVLAGGETQSAVNNARGHLFERFLAQLLHEYGYDSLSESDLNITSDGIEIDLVATHSFSGHEAVVEAKAYTSNVRARILTDFYGELVLYRFDHPEAHGYLFVTPRLVPEGEEQARKAAERDNRFHYLNSVKIVEKLRDRNLLRDPELPSLITSDPAVLVTDEGIYGALKVLDENSRLATRVVVWGRSGRSVPRPVLDLVAAHDYALGLDVTDLGADDGTVHAAVSHSEAPPIVVPVQASKSDFDPFPAAPKHFVGRTSYVASLKTFVDTQQGVFVLNAQSGWGKSSLALRAKQLVETAGGYAAVIDSRTASSPRYVAEVLRKSAQGAEEGGLLRLPSDQSWASLSSAVASIERAEWLRSAPMLIFFDQFENVFQQEGTTREFRDLSLRVRDSTAKLLVGFAWKTDMVSWTESHPYRFRDDIRGAGDQLVLMPMGPREVELLLRRLEKQVAVKLSKDLRQRLREYSQGFPWLFKKLAGHVINEINDGRSQEQLVSEALNVRSLFEADLAGLGPVETDALKHLARFAPISASEVTERYSAGVVQSLLDSRLAVAVGDKLDTYWDIFRDFLNTDRVPIEDGYIVRQNPASVGKLLTALMVRGGDEAVSNLAAALKTSDIVVFNLSRELRLFGLTLYEPNRVKLLPELIAADDQEGLIRSRVELALKRHRAYSLLIRLVERFSVQGVPISAFAQELQHAFAAVEAKPTTWHMYARAFAQWFEYAGLATLAGGNIRLADEEVEGTGELLGQSLPMRGRVQAIHMSPGPVLKLLSRVASEPVDAVGLTTREWRCLSLLVAMKLVRAESGGRLVPLDVPSVGVTPDRIRAGLECMPGVRQALVELERDPRAAAAVVGGIVRDETGATWSAATVALIGKHIRSWARRAGIRVT